MLILRVLLHYDLDLLLASLFFHEMGDPLLPWSPHFQCLKPLQRHAELLQVMDILGIDLEQHRYALQLDKLHHNPCFFLNVEEAVFPGTHVSK